MFNPTQIVIQAFVDELKDKYHLIYGVLEPAYPDIIGFVGALRWRILPTAMRPITT